MRRASLIFSPPSWSTPQTVLTDRSTLGASSACRSLATQVAVTFAKTTKSSFSAIFWLNAKSETLLRRSILNIASQLSFVPTSLGGSAGVDNEDAAIAHFREWLSRPENTRWMLIYDNYDEPEAYNVKMFFPYRAQGSVLITTRSSCLAFGTSLLLKKLEKGRGLEILAKRSSRPHATEGMSKSKIVSRYIS